MNPEAAPSPTRSLIIYASNRCNLRCAFCLEDGRRAETMLSLDDLRARLADVDPKDVRNVMFMGSETVLRADVTDVIGLLAELGFAEIGIATNGTALTRVERVRELVALGLRYIELSVHTLVPERSLLVSGRAFTYKKQRECLAVLEQVVAERLLSVTINAVMCTINVEDFHALVLEIERDFPRLAPRYQIKATMPTEAAVASSVVPSWDAVRQSGVVERIPPALHPRVSFIDFPLCVLHPHHHLSGNLTSLVVNDTYTHLDAEPYAAAHALASRARAFGPACDGCGVKLLCCGLDPKNLELGHDSACRPIDDDAASVLRRVIAWRREHDQPVSDELAADVDGAVRRLPVPPPPPPAEPPDPTRAFVEAYLAGNPRARTALFEVTDVSRHPDTARMDLRLRSGADELAVFVEPHDGGGRFYRSTRYLGVSYYSPPATMSPARVVRLMGAFARALARREPALSSEAVASLFRA
ncbi:MAG: radical SAM protein [Myxococcales bacterium]|nr:radical SAM protein [Myxococcales bacterium]